jgi:hypothetical protein
VESIVKTSTQNFSGGYLAPIMPPLGSQKGDGEKNDFYSGMIINKRK